MMLRERKCELRILYWIWVVKGHTELTTAKTLGNSVTMSPSWGIDCRMNFTQPKYNRDLDIRTGAEH